MVADGDYCWVVICKNRRYHNRENLFVGHHILLGETDAISRQPELHGQISVRCDSCGKEYSYTAGDILRMQLDSPIEFTPHPLFRS